MSRQAPNGIHSRESIGPAAPYPPTLTSWDRPGPVLTSEELLPPFVRPRQLRPEGPTPAAAETAPTAAEPAPTAAVPTPPAAEPAPQPPASEPQEQGADLSIEALLTATDGDRAPLEEQVKAGPVVLAARPETRIREAAVRDVASRLERLAARLRQEGMVAIPGTVAEGDRFDALLVGIVAGYLAADRD